MGKQTKKKNSVDKNKGGGKGKKGGEKRKRTGERKKMVLFLSKIYENRTVGFHQSES